MFAVDTIQEMPIYVSIVKYVVEYFATGACVEYAIG